MVQLSDLGASVEEHRRRSAIFTRKYPMSKAKRDSIGNLISRFRSEIERYVKTGELTDITISVNRRNKHREKKKGTVVDAKYVAGDARADEVLYHLGEMRRLFHKWPLDPLIRPHWVKVDAWMRAAQVNYRPIELPTEYSNAVPSTNDKIDHGLFDKMETDEKSRKALRHSLFYDENEEESDEEGRNDHTRK